MARFICLAFFCVLSASALAGGGNDDKKFRRWRRHLHKAHVAVDAAVLHREVALTLSSAIQQHDAKLVSEIFAGTPEDVLVKILGNIYELPEHECIPPVSALGLAVVCGNPQVVNVILNVAHSKPGLASATFAIDKHGQTPMNMAVYLDVSSVVFEFVSFAALHPSLAPVLEAPNALGHSPRETAVHNGRHDILSRLNIPVIPSVTALFLIATVLWR